MKLRLEDKGARERRIEVIPNWVDTTEITPQPRRNAWSAEHGLDDAFVVMHSGNVGHAQDLDTLVRAATFLRDLDRLRIMVIGFGARHGELTRLAQRLEVTRTVRFLDYQPRERLPLSLATGDLHYVGLARGLSGFVVPSRLYGILAAGRPVLVSADADSETVRIVEEVGCGIVVPPGRPELVAGVIRDVARGAALARRDGRPRPGLGRARGRPRGRVRPLPPGRRRRRREQLAVERVHVVRRAARPRSARACAPVRSRPSPARRSGRRARISSRSAIACVSRGRTRKPVSPSSTTSGTPPTLVATTGRPAASASMIVTGVPSLADVSTTASQIAYHGATSSW